MGATSLLRLARFYRVVCVTAFTHSLDIAQTILFIALIVSGILVHFYPGLSTTVESADMSGWVVAALTSGAILAVRLIFGLPDILYQRG